MSAETKLELLGLIDGAVRDGWAHTPAPAESLTSPTCERTAGGRGCARPGASTMGGRSAMPVHRLLGSEEQAILDLIEQWGWVDRSHRKLAHRGSYTGTVFVSSSTLLRVALKRGGQLPGEPVRPRPKVPVFPEVPWERNRIWIWDATHFTRARRSPTRASTSSPATGSGNLLSTEQTTRRRSCCPSQHSRTRGCSGPTGSPPDHGPEDPPILVAWSDNGSEMTAIDTRQFMGPMVIAQRHGRLGTPTDQAQIESLFSHLKGDWPHLTAITDPAALDTEPARIRTEYNTVRLHAAIGYLTPDDEHHGRGPAIRRARAAGLKRARAERIKQIEPASHDHAPQHRSPPAPSGEEGRF